MLESPDTTSTVAAVISTAATVAGGVVAIGVFVVRALVAKDLRPLSDSIVTLVAEQRATQHALAEDRIARKDERAELRDEVRDRFGSLDGRVRALETTRTARSA